MAESIIQKLYRLALAKNKSKLKEMINVSFSIDVNYHDCTVIRLLARDGEFSAVEFLLDEFDANIIGAAEGYAESGFHEQVRRLHDEGACITSIIGSYASVGNLEAIKAINPNLKKQLNAMIWGLAFGGHKKLIEDILSEYQLPIEQWISTLLKAYAIGGHDQYIDELQTQFTSVETKQALIGGYARMGQAEKVYKILREYEYRPDFLVNAIQNFAFGGCLKQVKLLLQKYPRQRLIDVAAYGFAFAGYFCEVDKLSNLQTSIKSIIKGYASGGHHQKVNALMSQDRALVYDARSGYEQEAYLDNDKPIIKIMSMVDNPRLLNMLGDHLKNRLEGFSLFKKNKKTMHAYAIHYRLVHGLYANKAHYWLLQGKNGFRKKNIPYEIYIRIMAYLLGLSDEHAHQLYTAVHLKLQCLMLTDNMIKYQKGEIGPDDKIFNDREIIERFETRLKF